MRVIRWTSSGYENGRIAGYRDRQRIGDLVEIVDPAGWQETARASRNQSLAPWARHWTRGDFLDLALLLHRQSLTGLPPLDRYPELRGMDQYMADYVRGLVDGSGHSLEDIIWSQQYRHVYNFVHTPTQAEPALPSVAAGCTTIAFARTEQGPIIGFNMDDHVGWGDKSPRFGEPTLHLMPADRGYSHVMGLGWFNERGLCIHRSSHTYPNEPESVERFPVNVEDLVLRHCATVSEAIDMFGRYAAFGGPSNLVLVDAEGTAAAVEKGKTHCAVRWADDRGVVFATSGVALEPETRRFMDTDAENYRENLARYRRIETVVTAGSLTVEHMWEVLADHHPTDFVCKHFDRVPPGALGTLQQHVALPAQSRWFVRQYDPETHQHPCTFEPTEHGWTFAPSTCGSK